MPQQDGIMKPRFYHSLRSRVFHASRPHTPLYIPPVFPHNPSALPAQLCIDLSQSLVTVWNDALTLCLPRAFPGHTVCSTPAEICVGWKCLWEVRCGAI